MNEEEQIKKYMKGRCGCKDRKWNNEAKGGICPDCGQRVRIED